MRTRIVFALRHKIMAAFVFFLVGGLLLTGMTYQRHTLIRQRLQVIEEADDLINNALEVRRYEKNYFLYGGEDNYNLMIKYLTLVENQFKELRHFMEGTKGPQEKAFLTKMLDSYRQAVMEYMNQTEHDQNEIPPEAKKLAEAIRVLGHDFTIKMEELVSQERRVVDQLVTRQKTSLFIAFTLFCLLTLGVAYYLYFLIFSPLSRIEKAAEEVIRGGEQEIPRFVGSTEIQSLIGALNLMIRELDKKSEQLIQKEKMAALGTLTSGVAHELNNPLSNISSSTQILLEELDSGEIDFQRRLLEGVEQQVEKARDIVKSLLEFAREREFEPMPTNILTLVRQVVILIKGEIPKDVEIVMDIPADLEMEIDQRRVSQALMNLIINGMQAMGEGGGILRIGASRLEDGEQADIWIEDEGQGIPPDNIGKIFDPFFSTKDVGEGTGLGLYVTYGIVQKHGGRIEARPREEGGTRFVMTLPIRQAGEDVE